MKKMRKTLLAAASLLCSATLCTGIGAVVANSPAEVSAETTATYTKTVNGVEYTFEQDFNSLVYSELGNVVNYIPMQTAEGATLRHNPHSAAGYSLGGYTIAQADSAFTKSTGGLQFQFAAEGAWDSWARSEFLFGDLKITFGARPYNSTPGFQLEMYSFATGSSVAVPFDGSVLTNDATKNGANPVIIKHSTEVKDNALYMADGFATVKIHKNKCTAIGGDSAAAQGYWLTFSILEPGQTTETVLYNGYLANALYTDTHDSIGWGYSPNKGESYMTIKNTVASKEWTDVVCYDVADSEKLVGSNTGKVTDFAATDEEYMKGKTITASGYNTNPNGFITTMGSQANRGIEFRMKENTALATTGTKLYYYMNVWVGSSLVDIYPDDKGMFNVRTGWIDTANGGATKYEFGAITLIPFEVGAEYAVRVVKVAPENTDRTAGAVVRVYMAKCAADGSLAENWDAAPIYERYIARDRQASWNSKNQVGVHPGNNTVAHEMTISSNKYVFAKTNIDGVVKTHKLAKGGNFNLDDLYTKTENTLFLGWSKGAATYSADDFVAAGTVVYNNMQTCDENVYTPLAMEFAASEKASIRFRQRTVAGELLPLEVSLKWNVTAEDTNNVGAYFGGISFGYKLFASNGESFEEEVDNYTNGWMEDYSYSVIQSNIGEASYGMKFTMQAYVELNGVKYYTAERDMEQDGRSVDFVADAAVADVKASAEGDYVNLVEEGKYSYLTKEEYAVVKAAGAVINE